MEPNADNSRICHTKQNKKVLNVTQITTKNSLRDAERRSFGEEERKLPPLTNYCRTIDMRTNKLIHFLASSPFVLGASSFVFLTWRISLPVVHYFISNGGEYFHVHVG